MITLVRSTAFLILFGADALANAGGAMRSAPDPARDLRQTMAARRLLFQDPELAAFNIGVIVQDRVAILWGPAPSAEIAFRAELCVRTMLELSEVRNELIVIDWMEQKKRLPGKIEMPRPVLPELLPPELPSDVRQKAASPSVLTGQGSDAGKLPAAKTVARSEPPAPAAPAANRDETLIAAIRAWRARTPAYASVEFAVEEGRVFLRSTSPGQTDILQEAAQLIARMPNVNGVVVLSQPNGKRE